MLDTRLVKFHFKQGSSCFHVSNAKSFLVVHLQQHKRINAIDQSFTRHLQAEPVTDSGEESDTLFSVTEENSSQVESLTCWICQEEFSSETSLIQHYDDHMS